MITLCEIAITNGKVEVNSEVIFLSKTKLAREFFKELYTYLEIDYPKFYKMDSISKLYFLGVEVLLKNSEWTTEERNQTVLIAGTKNGCKESDNKHIATIMNADNLTPSPAIFVYTLPNIMLGEVCIRHGITGENTCLILLDECDPFLKQYSKILLSENDTTACISGYVNYQPEDYQCMLTLFAQE